MIMQANQALYAQLHPLKNPFSGVRLTADMMRFVGAVADAGANRPLATTFP